MRPEKNRRCGRCNREMEWMEYLIEGCAKERRSGWTTKKPLNESEDRIKEMKEIVNRKTV